MKGKILKQTSKEYKFGFYDGDVSFAKLPKGHSREVVKKISQLKNEPSWMTEIRLQGYEQFQKMPMPQWGPDLSSIDFDNLTYFIRPTNKIVDKWEGVPLKIRQTFKKLGIGKKEQEWLAGMATQYDSEMVYAAAKDELQKLGVIFESTDVAVQKYPKLVQKYFGKIIDAKHNKFAALNTAFWSGGTFIYIPPNVVLDRPLQSYFRINSRLSGQFERTLIIVDEKAKVDYIEGCTAPVFTTNNLHAAVVEVFVKRSAQCKYTTIQNWSNNVYNLVTKSADVAANGSMEWIDGNLGSKVNMKYPSCILRGEYARGNTLSIAIGMGKDVFQDAGAKMIHLANYTQSTILSKSVAGNGGSVNYRGTVVHDAKIKGAKSKVECDTMILDQASRSDTLPTNIVANNSSFIEHEAVVSKISDRQVYYLQSRGLSVDEARETIIMGFIEPFAKEIPLEYASELNALIKMEMEGDIG